MHRAILYNLDQHDSSLTYIAITPDTSNVITSSAFKKYNLTTAKLGEDNTRQILPEIKALLAKVNK